MFGFIKKAFFYRINNFINLLNATPLKCVLMRNEEFKVRPNMLMLIVMSLHFILLVLKQVHW